MAGQSLLDLASSLGDLFYPWVEVTRFSPDGKIEAISNAFSSLKEDQSLEAHTSIPARPFHELLASGKSVRTLIHSVSNQGKIVSYVRFRFDLTLFQQLHQQISTMLPPENFSKEKRQDPWRASIDQKISDYLTKTKSTPQALTTKQKREIVSKLRNEGWLDFKESSAYVAAKLMISRATVYNYLKTAEHLKQVHVHQVDAFTNEKFGGNPAGVVLDADTLDEAEMRKVARELNLSETAFVSSSELHDFKMRYFTPTGHEIAFCGHSTVGALYMIAQEKRYGVGQVGSYSFIVETLCGPIPMEITLGSHGDIRVAYNAPEVKLRKTFLSHKTLAEAAGFDLKLIDSSVPLMIEETNKNLFCLIGSLEGLKAIECDFKSLKAFCKEHDIVALCLFTKETFDPKNSFHMRCFAPLVGIPEDPVTGSVLGGLAACIDTHHLLPAGVHSFSVEQGHFVQRPGMVEVQFSKQRGNYHVKVFAEASHCFSTEINL